MSLFYYGFVFFSMNGVEMKVWRPSLTWLWEYEVLLVAWQASVTCWRFFLIFYLLIYIIIFYVYIIYFFNVYTYIFLYFSSSHCMNMDLSRFSFIAFVWFAVRFYFAGVVCLFCIFRSGLVIIVGVALVLCFWVESGTLLYALRQVLLGKP